MITEETIQKLNEMKLHTMANVLREILEALPAPLSLLRRKSECSSTASGPIATIVD